MAMQGFEQDTLRRSPLPPYAGTLPIQPTCTLINVECINSSDICKVVIVALDGAKRLIS